MNFIKKFQRNEITESVIYKKLSEISKDKHNSKVLLDISREELKHYNIWKKYTNLDIKPNIFVINFYVFITKIFGLSFWVKIMERGERFAQKAYDKISKYAPESIDIKHDEEQHEKKMIDMLEDKKLFYILSVVLWLNDALVELTWVLSGLTLWLQDPKLIVVVGPITWVAASLSMWASAYLSNKADWKKEKALKSAIYTWWAYFSTVIFLILPFLLIGNSFIALSTTLSVAILIIAGFNRYASIVKGYGF